MRRPPKFVWVIVVAAVLGLVVVAVGAWSVHQVNESEGHRDCQRAVSSRDDARAMWLYAIDAAEDPSDPKVKQFTRKLNELLPPLRCEGSDWVPVRKENPHD